MSNAEANDAEVQVARYAGLEPLTRQFDVGGIRIPVEAYAQVAAKENILLVEPVSHTTGRGAIQVSGGLEVFLSRCPPGQGPALHIHPKSTEIFHALDGTWQITWGRQGENSVEIGPRDTVCVPPGHFRAFRNVATQEATLLVLVVFDPDEGPEATETAAIVRQALERDFGGEVVKAFKGIGITFAE